VTDSPLAIAPHEAPGGSHRPARPDGPVAIEVRGIDKTFRIPDQKIDSFKERAIHPFRKPELRELQALREISFDVHRGEFFGIVGRNGSGKSTLLKILASIYRADAGTVRIAGRLAPFIELGVGFNPDLTARENVLLNGVMMGLSRREARGRLDAVLEFAELEDFIELKLKNYSSGMLVRLAFAVMIQADADVMLIDEVLAVGDASFQQKCADVFYGMRDRGKTVVLVTHDMAAAEQYCHRAMLIEDGLLQEIGDPKDVGRGYLKANFETAGKGTKPDGIDLIPHTGLLESWLEGPDGDRIENVEQGKPIRYRALLEANDDLDEPVFVILLSNPDGLYVSTFEQTLTVAEGEPDRMNAGDRVRLSGEIENLLRPGRFYLTCWVRQSRAQSNVSLQVVGLVDFVVFGTDRGGGLVSLPRTAEAVIEERA